MDIFQETRKTSKTIIFHLLEKDNKITRTYEKHLRNNKKKNNSSRKQTKARKAHNQQPDLCCLNLTLIKYFCFIDSETTNEFWSGCRDS